MQPIKCALIRKQARHVEADYYGAGPAVLAVLGPTAPRASDDRLRLRLSAPEDAVSVSASPACHRLSSRNPLAPSSNIFLSSASSL